MKPMILDIETYPNYNLFVFRKGKKIKKFESWSSFSLKDKKAIRKLMAKNLIVTYNGKKYDEPLVNYALQKGATVEQMYLASKSLIENRVHPYAFMKSVHIPSLLPMEHIDLFEPSPAVMISLKLYGSRLGSKILWDLPYDPHVPITEEQAKILNDYCVNDLDVTKDLYDAVKDRLDLRTKLSEEYGINLMSKSDAQIAEAVMVSELKKLEIVAERPRLDDGYTCKYKPPKYIKFKSKRLKELLKDIESIDFTLSGSGNVILPAKLTQSIIDIGDTTYKIGIGGLHSQESSMAVTTPMNNADFASYYPFILINNGYYPKHLGSAFIEIYERIVRTRLEAKKAGDKLVADSLKITINGLFGKLGSKWSKVYSPDLMLQITLTGQLTLLMLIEQFEAKGISVKSANTDGLEYTGENSYKAKKIIKKLEEATGYEMEIGEYEALYARDVNNYVAKYKGYVKAKGVYAEPTLTKNSQTSIVFKAVRDFIDKGTSMKKTINKCEDIKQFLTARQVKGGGLWSDTIPEMYPPDWQAKLDSKRGLTKKIIGEREKMEAQWVKEHGTYLGKVVRWYYSENGSTIHYKSNGNKVPKSDAAKPMMTLTKKIPKDLDYTWYYNEAKQMLEDLGYEQA
jgi:DNA polymerase elongation subunit (family B)